jgi:hypothetical protein
MSTSEFFENIFSISCTESSLGIVELRNFRVDVISKIIDWSYSGTFSFNQSEFMTFYYLSRHFGIWQLEKELRAELSEIATKDNVLDFCTQCYENGYTEELKLLKQYLIKFIENLPLELVSQVLDVVTFAGVLQESEFTNGRKIEMINVFLGDWKTNQQEQEALRNCLTQDGSLKKLLIGKEYAWINKEWLRSLPGK